VNGRMGSTAYAVAAAFVVAMTVTASAGLYSILQQWNFLVPAIVGALGAAAVSVGSRWKSLLLAETVALTTVAFVVVGVLVAGGGIPSPGAVGDLFGGLTSGWAELLAGTPPTDLTPELRVVPFTLTWVGTAIGLEVLRRIPQPALPILGPIATFVVTTLLTESDRTIALVVGATLIVGALAIGIIQQRALRGVVADELDTASARRRRIGFTAALVLLVSLAAPWLGPRLPLAEANERYDLRNEVVPPWNPLELPSPLTQLKPALDSPDDEDAEEKPVMFTVQSEDQPTRFATAVMGSYDGRVWTVGSAVGTAPNEFRPVDSRLPEPPDEIAGDDTVSATVTVGDLAGPWVPTPGWPRTFAVTELPDGGTGEDVAVRENINTGTLAVPGGLDAGTVYDITAQPTPALSDDELSGREMRPLTSELDLSVLPPEINNLAADFTEGEQGWDIIVKLRDALRQGFYVVDEQVPPGHSYYRIDQFLADPDRIFGYEEQYAATAALIGRIADLPTRVVVGYEIPADRYVDGVADVRENDITAWIEARVDGVGWVPVDVTPEKVLEPEELQQQTVPQVVPTQNDQPPPPPPPQLDVVPDNEQEDEEPDEEEEEEFEPVVHAFSGPSVGPYVAAGGASGVALVALFVAVVVGYKAYRYRRRRSAKEPAYRIAGAWRELADRYHEAGVPIPKRATPLETANAYLATEPSANEVRPALLGLVSTVDRAAWHHDPPPSEQAEQAWGYCDGVLSALAHDRSWWQRIKMRLDPRPLWHRDVWLRAQHSTGRAQSVSSGEGS
jgi:transglutaminase-like putative cysteine protease